MAENKTTDSPIIKICSFIVDKRNLFFLLFIIAIIFSIFSKDWVNVENDISSYLSEDTETKKALELMDNEFVTFGTAKVMVANLSFKQASAMEEMIEGMDGVSSVTFVSEDDEDIDSHYNNSSALFDVTFKYSEDDDKVLDALSNLENKLSGYDYYISTSLGNQQAEIIAQEMSKIIVIVAVIVVLVLVLTSQTYGEVPVLLLTFVASAIINMGTNFVFGTISFVSNSVTVVLQLALSIDYAIIFCNRFKEERKELSVRDAAIISLSKAIPEISSSSLTTVSGLLALTFMQFGIGKDMGIVLIKAIIISLLSVFLLMPGLLVDFSGIMEKTKHKNFVPDIPFVGKFAYATRIIVPPIFLIIIIIAAVLSQSCPYVYGYSTLTTPIQNETQIADEMIEENFGNVNFVALCIPGADYSCEKKLIADLEACDEVDYVVSLSNQEAMGGYMLTDSLSPRQFSELVDIDVELAGMLYSVYAADKEEYGRIIGGIEYYKIPLIDMIMFMYDKVEEGYVTLDNDTKTYLDNIYEQVADGRKQLQGENYDRMLVYLTLPEESDETFKFLDEMHDMAYKYYDKDTDGAVYVAGDSTSEYDLKESFATDNVVVSVLSILFVLVILLFTFKSAGMPVLLIAVIQGSIFINFSFPTVMHENLFFMGYLIVSSIQMGANIDYAIVISSRYTELRAKGMNRKDSIIDTMNFAFPTIITSGMILAIAGTLIGQMTSEPTITGIGQCLGRGTIISIILVMFALPQILILGDKVIAMTAFSISMPVHTREEKGITRIDGRIRGTVNGTVIGTLKGIVIGDVQAVVVSGNMESADESVFDDELKIEENDENKAKEEQEDKEVKNEKEEN